MHINLLHNFIHIYICSMYKINDHTSLWSVDAFSVCGRPLSVEDKAAKVHLLKGFGHFL